MDEQKPNDEQEELQKRRQAAIDVLTEFVSSYAPATVKDASTFFTTKEIIDSIKEHTGVIFEHGEIFDLMGSMGYKSAPINGLELNWLLKKETE